MTLPLALALSVLAADVSPETSWQRVSMGGDLIGYMKTEYRAEGDNVRCIEEQLVVLKDVRTGKEVRQEQHESYLIATSLSLLAFERETQLRDVGEQATRRVSGKVEGGKLTIVDDLEGSERSTTLDAPKGLLSQGVSLFLYASLEEEKPLEFTVLSTRIRGTAAAKTVVVRRGSEAVKVGGVEESAWVLEETTEEFPTLSTRILYLPPGEARPNGRIVQKEQRDSKGSVPIVLYESCTEEEARAWMASH